MERELPDFVSDSPPAPEADAPAPESVAAAAPEAGSPADVQGDGQPRGADGKFLPKDGAAPAAAPVAAAPAPAPQAPVSDPTPAAQPDPMAPVAALVDERFKRQAAEKELAELRAWKSEQEAAAQRQPPPPAPDPQKDPAGFQAFQADRHDQLLYETRRDTSRMVAEMQHGKELVDGAYEWGVARCDQDPHFNQQVRTAANPYAFVVTAFQQHQAAERGREIATKYTPEDFQAFEAWKAAQTAPAPQAGGAPQPQAQPAAAPAAPAQKPTPPRPSIAAAPSASQSGQAVPRDGGATYDAMFGP